MQTTLNRGVAGNLPIRIGGIGDVNRTIGSAEVIQKPVAVVFRAPLVRPFIPIKTPGFYGHIIARNIPERRLERPLSFLLFVIYPPCLRRCPPDTATGRLIQMNKSAIARLTQRN